MSVTGNWVKKMTQVNDEITGAFIDYLRWVCPPSAPSSAGSLLELEFTTAEGTDSISSVADGANMLDIIWLNNRGTLKIITLGAGWIEVFLRR